IPGVSQLEAVFDKAAATTIKDFKSKASGCPAKVKAPTAADAQAAVACLKGAAEAAFKAGAVAGIKEAIQQVVSAASKGAGQLQSAVASLASKFSSIPGVGGLEAAFAKAEAATIGTFRQKAGGCAARVKQATTQEAQAAVGCLKD